MKLKTFVIAIVAIFIVAYPFFGLQRSEKPVNFDEHIRVALRAVGNELLLTNNDSTSLVLPIKKIGDHTFEMQFEKELAIAPETLVEAVDNSLKEAHLSERYIVEVKQCATNEISYSFKIIGEKENDIVPCLGRELPKDCYSIQVLFLGRNTFSDTSNFIPFTILLIVIAVFLTLYLLKRRREEQPANDENTVKIGSYDFYPTQNKLIKDQKEIKLSAKECELLKLLSEQQNDIVKRDVLTKEIWEDNGVFVGRSLDTFISKLRKKFKDDDRIQIVNIHGVGYKLEVN